MKILNRKASYEYNLGDRVVAGMVLTGTEVKSLREGTASISEAYCVFHSGQLWVKNMNISHWKQGSYTNHTPLRDRQLLLNKTEVQKLLKKTREKGTTIVPLTVFFSETGYAKMEIAIGRGKKAFDKRESIKERDVERNLRRRED